MGTIGTRKNLVVGGYTFVGDELTNLKVLQFQVGGSPSGHSAGYNPEGGAFYVVPGSKVFKIKAIVVATAFGGSGKVAFETGYADTSVGHAANAAGTNSVSFKSGSTLGNSNGQFGNRFTANWETPVELVLRGNVPTGKYPSMYFELSSDAAWALLYGTEEDA